MPDTLHRRGEDPHRWDFRCIVNPCFWGSAARWFALIHRRDERYGGSADPYTNIQHEWRMLLRGEAVQRSVVALVSTRRGAPARRWSTSPVSNEGTVKAPAVRQTYDARSPDA